MSKMSIWIKLYYQIRPLIPRIFQIHMRRRRAKKIAKLSQSWPICSALAITSPGNNIWPEKKLFCVVLVHDVETAHGYSKCEKLAAIDSDYGFRSSFNFVPERYRIKRNYIQTLKDRGFEVGVHGLKHDGKLFMNSRIFSRRAIKINQYLELWNSSGFYSPSMHYNKDFLDLLNIEYDQSTFDTDPFEPQPQHIGKIFPSVVEKSDGSHCYVELPYTLPQDHTLYIILREKTNDIWKRKLDWLVENRGLVLIKTHPDYIDFESDQKLSTNHYPASFYSDFLDYIIRKYPDAFWHALPKEVAQYWRSKNEPVK